MTGRLGMAELPKDADQLLRQLVTGDAWWLRSGLPIMTQYAVQNSSGDGRVMDAALGKRMFQNLLQDILVQRTFRLCRRIVDQQGLGTKSNHVTGQGNWLARRRISPRQTTCPRDGVRG